VANQSAEWKHFRKFAPAILAVPKAEIEKEKRKIERQKQRKRRSSER
jgi:hypothetical protein